MANERLLHRRRRGKAPLWLAATLLSGILAAACPSHHHPPGGTDGPPRSPAFLDPLTEQERKLAIDRARADARVRELVGADARVGSVLFQVLKSDSPQEPRPRRLAAVLLYGVTSQQGARAVVDLGAQQVVEVERIDPFGVPLGLDDLQEAWALAQREEMLHLLPLRYGTPRNMEDFTKNDFWVTRYHPWEIYAALLPTFLNGEAVDKTDIVVWYTGSVHHLVRDEDRTQEGGWMALAMWAEFQLKPHNLFGANPLYP